MTTLIVITGSILAIAGCSAYAYLDHNFAKLR